MLDPRKNSLLPLFFNFLIFGFAILSTTSTATRAAVNSEASTTTPTVAAVVSRDQVPCTTCVVPSPPPVVPCPPPPPPPCPPPPPPPCPPPPCVKCLPMPPPCTGCEQPETGPLPLPGTSGTPVPYFPYQLYNFPADSGASSSLHLEMNAAGFATSLALGGLLYVLRF